MSAPQHLHITAAEPSGDLLAREVVEHLRACDPALAISGIGGAELATVGIDSPFDIAPLGVFGLVEGARAYPTVLRLADAAADHIIASGADVAVLVDSWGFTIRVAERVRQRAPGIRLIKLVGPQVFAARAGRAKKLARAVDHVLCIHEMERSYYAPFGLKTTVIGNPALSRAGPGDGEGFRARHGIAADAPLLLVLPGSRRAEITRLAATLMDAALRARAALPGLTIAALPAPGLDALFAARAGARLEDVTVLPGAAERFDAMAAADLALAASGTVTSEVAMQSTPVIATYKLGWITWAIGRSLLVYNRTITLMNIASGDREVVPEFVQTSFRARPIAKALVALLKDADARNAQVRAQDEALRRMGVGDSPAARVAAEAILADLAALREAPR